MKLRRIASAFLAGVTALAAAVSMSVTASADSMLDAKKTADSGKSFTLKLNDNTYHDYKIKLSKGGDLKIDLKGSSNRIFVYVVDSDGSSIASSKNNSTTKSGVIYDRSEYVFCDWDSKKELLSATVVYKDLDKGSYYIRIYHDKYYRYSGTGKTTIKFTYPQGGSDDSGKASIAVPIKKGASMQLDAGVSGAKWSTSDKSVISVSDGGKITANKKGTATITAKADGSSSSVTFKVTE